MHSYKYAIRFIWASFSITFRKNQLLQPWLYLAVGNLGVVLIWFIPLGLTVGLIGFRPAGMVLIGLTSIFLLYSFHIWGKITREPAVKILANVFQNNPDSQEEEGQGVSKFEHWPDILIWSLVRPVIRAQFSVRKFLWPGKEQKLSWSESHALIIPLIILENLGLKNAVSRLRNLIETNLLRFKPGFIKVDLIAKFVQWVLSILGILAGLSAAVFISEPLSPDPWQRILALGIVLAVSWLFITLGHLFSGFARSCYAAALYQWVVNVKEARESGDSTKAVPPEILRQALGQSEKNKNKKER